MRISDWSSDVCSSDLAGRARRSTGGDAPDQAGARSRKHHESRQDPAELTEGCCDRGLAAGSDGRLQGLAASAANDGVTGIHRSMDAYAGSSFAGSDRTSVEEGNSVSERVALDGRRTMQKKK